MNKVNLIIAAMNIEVQALLDNLNNFEERLKNRIAALIYD